MNVVPVYEAKNKLPQYVHIAEEIEPVAISRRNKTVAYIISAKEFEQYKQYSSTPQFIKKLESWRNKYSSLFSDSEINEIFESGKEGSDNPPSWESEVFKDALQ